MRGDEVQHAFFDVRPDRGAALFPGGRPAEILDQLPEVGHVGERDDDLEVPLLARGRLHDVDRAADPDLSRLRVDPPPFVRSVETATVNGGLELRLHLAEGADYRVGQADGATFVNLFARRSPPAAETAAEIDQIAPAAGRIGKLRGRLSRSQNAIGQGLQPPEWIDAVLAARSRDAAAPTFAPDGLYFLGPRYDAPWGLPDRTAAYDALP